MKRHPVKKDSSINAYMDYIIDWMDFKGIQKDDTYNIHGSFEITPRVLQALKRMESKGLIKIIRNDVIRTSGLAKKIFGKVVGWGQVNYHREIQILRG